MKRLRGDRSEELKPQGDKFLDSVKETIDGEKYNEFIKVMLSFDKKSRLESSASASASVVDEMKKGVNRLFKDNKELILGFNAFLPKRSEIPVPVSEPEHVAVIQQSCTFLQRIRELDNGTLFHSFSHVMDHLRNEIITPVEASAELNGLLKGHNDLIYGFNSFLPQCQDQAPELDCDREVSHEKPEPEYRPTPSYRFMPINDPNRVAPSEFADDIAASVLNYDFRIEPHPSNRDHSSNKHMDRTDQYDQVLFRIDDERREMDMAIDLVKSTIKQVKMLINEQLQVQGHLSSANLRCIEQLYGDNGPDVISILHNSPGRVLPVILGRLRQKRKEWLRCRSDFNKVWNPVFAENYYKSLGHQSFQSKA